MKRKGNLIEKIANMDNLYLAYYKAQRGKSGKINVYNYSVNLHTNLLDLREEILSGYINVGDYNYFTIYDPKERLICAAPFGQRVLHHAIMNVCHEYFEKGQIFDSYASRINKGTYAALDRAKNNIKKNIWFLKLDFKKFFDSLDHVVLINQLNSIFKDIELLCIFDKIINSYELKEGKGVPIGNLTSQYFANNYLVGLDHFIKEQLGIKYYVRYMDDLCLWHNDKDALNNAKQAIINYSNEKLKLELKPEYFNKVAHGVPFLGYILYPDGIKLARRSKNRFVTKYRLYENNLINGIWSQKEFQRHTEPLIAFTEYANALEFRKSVVKYFEI